MIDRKLMEIQTLESQGGPFLLLAQARLPQWGGSFANTFFRDDDERDYEVLCDRLYEQSSAYEIYCDRLYEQNEETSSQVSRDFLQVSRDHAIIFSTTLGLEFRIRGDNIYMSIGVTIIDAFLNQATVEDFMRPRRTFPLEAGPYVLFEAAYSGDKAGKDCVAIDIPVGTYPMLIEIPVIVDDQRYEVWKLNLR